MTTPLEDASAAAEALAEAFGGAAHDAALVLGSGWGAAAERLGTVCGEVDASTLSGFAASGVVGHSGRIRSLEVGGRRVLCFLGRTHLYEGRGVRAVAHGVRVAAAAGCRVVVLTNACGGVRAGLVPGQPVLISDHLNLTWQSPLLEPHFLDLTDLYSPRLRALARELDPTLVEGVYAMFPGPMFETPAEVRMAGILGADLVGMSTALEAIAAREAGLEVLGISLVTNLAAGLSGQPLDHEEVLATGRAAAERMGDLLAALVARL
jgi:purine-nucleoside phosphorylase